MELIDERINNILEEVIRNKSLELEGRLIEFNSYLDHCHSCLIIPPKISVSDFVGQIKGLSSHEVSSLGMDYAIKWQRGFGMLTFSEKGLSFIRKYIRNQKQHHESRDVIDILEYIPSEETSPRS